MSKLNDLTAKLSLLGDKITVLSDNAVIARSLGGKVTCYNLDDDTVLARTYDDIKVISPENTNAYLIGYDNEDETQHILNKQMRILGKFRGETIKKVYLDSVIILNRTPSNTYRIIDITGSDLMPNMATGVQVFDINKETVIIYANYKNGYAKISRIVLSEHKLKINDIGDISDKDRVVVGYNTVAIYYKSIEKLKLYNYDGKMTLVINRGYLKESTNKQGNRIYRVLDGYSRVVTTFESI